MLATVAVRVSSMKVEEMRLLILCCILLYQVEGVKEMSGNNCVRFLDSHYVVNIVRNYHHIEHMAELVTKLREERIITWTTYTIVMQRIVQSIHGNCILKAMLKRKRRQAVVGGALLFVGGALITPLVENFLHPNTATKEDMIRVNSYLSDLANHVNDLEQRLRYMERQSEILELLLGITTALEVEMEKFTELTTSAGYSTIQYKLLEPVRNLYERRKIINASRIVDLMQGRIPHATWKLSAKMIENENCSMANLQIALYAAVPSLECLEIAETTPEYIVLKKESKCLILQPLTSLTLLPDKTFFAQANYFVSADCNITGLDIDFKFKNGVLLAKPRTNGSAIGDCGDVQRMEVRDSQGVAARVDCSAFVSAGSDAPKVTDLFSPRIKAWTINKTVIAKAEDEEFLYVVNDMSIPTLATETSMPGSGTEETMVNERDLGWLALLCLPLIGLGVAAGWKLRREKQESTRSFNRRPEITVLHTDEDLKKSQDLINDLKNILEMRTYISTSSFDTASDVTSVSTKISSMRTDFYTRRSMQGMDRLDEISASTGRRRST